MDLLIFSCQHTSVDTTGARDSYVGALLCNIVDDRTVPALTYGNMDNCHGSIGSKKVIVILLIKKSIFVC